MNAFDEKATVSVLKMDGCTGNLGAELETFMCDVN